MKSINEAMKNLKEDNNFKETKVKLGMVSRTLYSQDELDLFNVIKNRLHGIEDYVVGFNINLTLGNKYAYVVFGLAASTDSVFEVVFNTESFGKVDSVKTTYSNQEITVDFLNLAQELYKLKKLKIERR